MGGLPWKRVLGKGLLYIMAGVVFWGKQWKEKGGECILFAFWMSDKIHGPHSDKNSEDLQLCYTSLIPKQEWEWDLRWTWSSLLTMLRLLPLSLSFRAGCKCHDVEVYRLFRFSYLLTPKPFMLLYLWFVNRGLAKDCLNTGFITKSLCRMKTERRGGKLR